MEYQFKLVDAFTKTRYAGNPCGVVSHAEGLSDAQMQAIAREINASETAFVTPSTVADFRVRFFTPANEVPLAGHPTIATMHALAEEGRIDLSTGARRVHQELNVGVLPVDLSKDSDGFTRVVMTQAKPVFGAILDRDACAAALGLPLDALRDDLPAQVVSTGTPQAMIPVRSLAALRSVKPNVALMGALEKSGGFFSSHAFALETLDPAHRTHARHFAASSGIAEDPFTGSATGGMGAYLWKYGLIREPSFTVEQGHIIGRPGIGEVQVEGIGDEPTVVRIAGTAITVLRGVLEV